MLQLQYYSKKMSKYRFSLTQHLPLFVCVRIFPVRCPPWQLPKYLPTHLSNRSTTSPKSSSQSQIQSKKKKDNQRKRGNGLQKRNSCSMQRNPSRVFISSLPVRRRRRRRRLARAPPSPLTRGLASMRRARV